MRIVFSSRPAFGHVFAIAPLARAAQEAGHQVIFATGESFLPRLKGWGFEGAKVGEPIEWAFQQAASAYPHLLQPEQPEFGARMFVDVLGPRSFADMTALIQEAQPDLIVYEATDLGAAVAGAAAGVPVVCHSLSVWVPAFFDAMSARLPALWEGTGGEPTVDVTVGDAFLDIWPPSMRPDGMVAPRTLDLRPETWGDPEASIPDWLEDADRPLVFVSLGTVFWGKELLTKVLDALALVECDALVLAGVDANPDELAAPNPRVRVAGFVNQAEVLRRADAVIHHGGAGTMLGSLARGLPALVLPEGADRPFTAASLAQRGAGMAVEPRAATPADIAEGLSRVLREPAYREKALEVQREIGAMPSPAEVVTRLGSLV